MIREKESFWIEDGEIWLKVPYDPILVDLFRPSGRWHKEHRAWRFPLGAAPLLPWSRLPREAWEAYWAFLLGKAHRVWHLTQEVAGEMGLLPEQVADLKAVLRAFLRYLFGRGPNGFVLANGTGTGKTYIYGAFVRLVRELGLTPLVVVPNEDLLRQVREVVGEGYTLTTYGKLDPKAVGRGHLLVLDESHLAKRVFSGASDRGRRTLAASNRAGFVLYVSATPFDRPWEAAYILTPTRFYLWRGFRRLKDFLGQYGVYTRIGFSGAEEYYFAGSLEDLKRFHHTLVATGFLRKRLYRPQVPVEYQVPVLEGISQEERSLLREVRRRLAHAAVNAHPEDRGIVKAHRTLLSRAILERAKLRAALPLVAELLDEGWHVALFLQYRAEKGLDLSSEEAFEALWEEAEARGGRTLHRYLLPALYGLRLHLPSPVEMVGEAFGHLGEALAFYTGAESPSRLARTKERWNAGEVRLLVATAAKGGTGLSLHDTTGTRPTAQVVLTLPWTATQLDQILGRVVRVGLKSPVRILLPAAPLPFERKLAATIAHSLHTLGYAVRGGEEVVPQKVVEAFLYDLALVDPEAFQELLDVD